MALWLQKHEPRTLDDLTCHPKISDSLRQMAQSGNIPNVIFYGRQGSGRKTRARCFLHAVYGDRVHQLKVSQIVLDDKSKGEIYQVFSNFHVEVSADEMGNKDKVVISSLVKKTMGQTTNAFRTEGPSFRVVVIKDADQLSWEAQAALRRTMETSHKNCRVILICESLSKLMKPLRSRCLCMRIPTASNPEILNVMKTITVREGLTPKVEYLVDLTKQSRRNLERAILLLELAAIQKYPKAENLAYLPWEMSVVNMVKLLVTNPSPQSLLEIRNLAYELMATNVSMSDVLELVHRLQLTHIGDKPLALELTRYASKFSEAMNACQNEVTQVEAFFACAAFAIKQRMVGV